MRGLILICAMAVAVSGCATKRYGRLQPLTTAEQHVYSCREIEVEIAKVEAFRGQVSNGARINVASVLGFLGDYGIGNANEKNQADRTATQRMNELLALRAQERCGLITQAASHPPQKRPEQVPSMPAVAPTKAVGNARVRCVTCRD